MLPGVKAEEAYPPLHLGIPAFSAWPQAAASGSAVPEKGISPLRISRSSYASASKALKGRVR